MADSVLARMAVYLDANTAAFNSKLLQSSQQLRTLSEVAKTAGATLGLTFGTYALFQGLKGGIGLIADFEKQMSTVKALTGATGNDFKALSDNALELGRSSQYTATQIGTLQAEFARLGFSTAEILQATQATVNLATATGEDLAKATVIVGSAVRQFNLPTTEAGHLADVMTGAFNKTALALDDFGEAMKYVGPAAAAANLTFEQTSALLGILADSGIKGSMAGTSLRRILVDLAKDSRPLSEKLTELANKGITLANATDDIGRIASTALIVLEKGVSQVDPLTQSFKNLNGEAQRVADIMRDNLSGDFDRFSAAAKNMVIQLGPGTGFLREFTQEWTNLFNAFSTDKMSQVEKFVLFIGQGPSGLANKFAEISAAAKKVNDNAKNTFLTYAKGFDDASKAAEKFILLQNSALIKAQSTEADTRGKTGLETLNENAKAAIANYKLLITAAQEFVRATSEKQFTPQADHIIRSIKFLEDEIKKLEEQQKGAASNSVFVQYSRQIAKLNLEILDIQYKLKALPAGAMDLKMPGLQKFDNANNPLGGGLSEKQVQDQISGIKKIEPAVKSLADQYERVSRSIQTAALVMLQFQVTQDATGKKTEQLKDIMINWGQAIKDIAGIALVQLGESLGKVLAGQEAFGQGFLESFAGFLKQFGQLLIAAGVAKIAADVLLETPAGGFAAIAAGVALVALASFMSAKNSPGSGHAAGATASAGRNTGAGYQQMQVSGQFVVRGQDLYVVLSNYNNNKNG